MSAFTSEHTANVDVWVAQKTGLSPRIAVAIEDLLQQQLRNSSNAIPVDPVAIAERLDCRVVLEDVPAGRLEFTPRGKVIRVPKRASRVNQRFSIAHELGHLLFVRENGEVVRPTYDDESQTSPDGVLRKVARTRLEALCDTAARVILVPREALEVEAETKRFRANDIQKLLDFASLFEVSPTVMFQRLRDIGKLKGEFTSALLEYRANRITGQEPKWRVAARTLPSRSALAPSLWENQGVDHLGISLPDPDELSQYTELSVSSFSHADKRWTMSASSSKVNRNFLLVRITFQSPQLTLFPL